MNSESLQLKIERLTWIDALLPGRFDFKVEMAIGEQRHHGYGSDPNRDIAMVKAFAEAVERTVFVEHKFSTTSGLTAHGTPEKARQAAVNELIERDLILTHFFGNQPFAPLNLDGESVRVIAPFQIWAQAQKIRILFFQLGKTGVLAVLDGREADKPFGFILGAAKKETSSDSVRSALVECSRQLLYLMAQDDRMKNLSLDEFHRRTTHGFQDHGALALNLDYAAQIAHLFDMGGKAFEDLDQAHVEVRDVLTKIPELKGCPLFFAKASSPLAQEIFLGPCNLSRINMDRLRELLGRNVDPEELLKLPHPFN